MIDIKQQSLDLELNYAKENLREIFSEYKDSLAALPLAHIKKIINSPIPEGRKDIQAIVDELKSFEDELPEILFRMVLRVITTERITVQGLVGSIFPKFSGGGVLYRKFGLIATLLESVLKNKSISSELVNGEHIFTSSLKLNPVLQARVDYLDYVLPPLAVPKLTNNKSIGYQTFREHIITGKPHKHHDFEICLDHINRLNAIDHCVEERVKYLTNAKFKNELKLNKQNEWESKTEFELRKEQHKKLHEEVPNKVSIMMALGNKFKILSKYDSRLRTYTKAHHFNYQGSKYLKATIQAHTKELVTGEW